MKGPSDHLLTDAQVPLTSFAKQQLAELATSKITLEGRAGMGSNVTAEMRLSAKEETQKADSIASDSNKVKDLYGKNIQVDLSNYVFGKASNSDSLFSAPNLTTTSISKIMLIVRAITLHRNTK